MKPEEPSLEPSGDAVKERSSAPPSRPGGKFSRLLEGWELGAVVVAIVLVAALVAVPRAAEPSAFPVPLVDSTEEAAERTKLAALADRAERDGLPFETRAVGDAVRRVGLALSGTGSREHAGRLLIERVQAAVMAGQLDGLVRLRAYQARAFVAAVRAQDFRQAPSAELRALGGDFLERAKRNGWIGPSGCLGTDDELQTLFILRWAELTQLHARPELKASLGELRRYYRFLILHPEADPSEDPARARAKARLRYVTALARRDSEYPVGLARGSLLAQLGRWPESAQSLDGYLGRPGGAPWNLRARNYLLFAAKHGGETAEPQPF